jgi:uncharacterized membrane protein
MSFDYVSEIFLRQMFLYPWDFAAFFWFLLCWLGYTYVVDNYLRGLRGLSARMHLYRVQWMTMALKRDNKVIETNIIKNIQSSVSFLASTAILIIAGLLAMLSASNVAMGIIKQMPFAEPQSKIVWYTKVFVLIYLFVYSFFKLTWSLRQMNYCAIMIGAMPVVETKQEMEDYIPTARRTAMVATMAAKDMNRGIRAYYFGMAVLIWLVPPGLFILASLWVVIILYRREFKSEIIKVMNMPSKLPGAGDSLQSIRGHSVKEGE